MLQYTENVYFLSVICATLGCKMAPSWIQRVILGIISQVGTHSPSYITMHLYAKFQLHVCNVHPGQAFWNR